MTPRLPEGVVRKYFYDPPDPEVLAQADAGLSAADSALLAALDRTTIDARCRRLRVTRMTWAGVCSALFLLTIVLDFTLLALPLLGATVVLGVKAFTAPRNHARLAGEQARQAAAAAEAAKVHWGSIRDEYLRQFNLAEPKPSDADMDRTLAQDIAALRSRALRSLSLAPSELVRPARFGAPDDVEWSPFNSSDPQEPFVVYGPAYGEGFPVSSAVGKDGRRRYGRYSIMIICTTRYHLAVYRCVLDFFTGELDNESSMEMHYQDVVSVRTYSDPDPGRRIEIEPRPSQAHLFPPGTERCFELLVSGGMTLRMVTGLTNRETTEFRRAGQEGMVYQGTDPDFQAVADAVRMMLREKKGGMEGPALVV